MQFHEQIWMMAFSLPIPSISYEVWQGAKKINFNQKLQAWKNFRVFSICAFTLCAPSDSTSLWLCKWLVAAFHLYFLAWLCWLWIEMMVLFLSYPRHPTLNALPHNFWETVFYCIISVRDQVSYQDFLQKREKQSNNVFNA